RRWAACQAAEPGPRTVAARAYVTDSGGFPLTSEFVPLYIQCMADEDLPQPPQADRGSTGKGEVVPAPAVRRLSLYLRELEGFLRREPKTISSKQLGDALNLTDAQVRKNLAYFGQFGHPGIGYHVDALVTRIR